MRPSAILGIVVAALIGLGGVSLAVLVLWDRSGGKLWFYWIAPLLALGIAGMMATLVLQYWLRVGRLEARGRPRGE